MDSIDVTVTRSSFPLTSFSIIIGDNTFTLNPGQLKKLKVPKSEELLVIVSSFWLKKEIKLLLRENSAIKIRHGLPDAYYLFGMSLVVILAVLTFFGLFSPSMLPIILILYFLPMMYVTYIKRENYFKIIVDE